MASFLSASLPHNICTWLKEKKGSLTSGLQMKKKKVCLESLSVTCLKTSESGIPKVQSMSQLPSLKRPDRAESLEHDAICLPQSTLVGT